MEVSLFEIGQHCADHSGETFPEGMRITRPARFTVRVGRCRRTPCFRPDREVLDSGAAGRLSVCER
jgi:hypothetical protein